MRNTVFFQHGNVTMAADGETILDALREMGPYLNWFPKRAFPKFEKLAQALEATEGEGVIRSDEFHCTFAVPGLKERE